MIRNSFSLFCESTVKYDPWRVLGVQKGVPLNVLREKYHSLAQTYHPNFVKEGKGDMAKMKEIDDAYLWVTKAPTVDKRYRNLVGDSSKFYYSLLPKWMAKNLDEMPRYWTWLRWKMPAAAFFAGIMTVFYIMGRLWPTHRWLVYTVALAFTIDCLLHVSLTPIIILAIFFRLMGEQEHYSLAWLQSPKNFWRRGLDY
ncbi:chaperone protein DNAj [Perkinsela sp. CCAP 1560/4]|nr:chaperone protein DNAj [Perkinsela sp. CCAP 1560/4]|eukprot:KNH08353.1 chaperone protein DNAj [Perkinsela sp. CCAP 1560/4]